jgi:hypothetical protein
LGQSAINDFHGALGQFINYRYALADLEPDRKLFLAISLTAHGSLCGRRFVQSVGELAEVNGLVYDEICALTEYGSLSCAAAIPNSTIKWEKGSGDEG